MSMVSRFINSIIGKPVRVELPPKVKRRCFRCGELGLEEDASQCGSCQGTQPKAYLSRFATHAPMFCPVMGLRGSGKTVYLHSLTQRLLNFSQIYSTFSFEGVDINTTNWLRSTRRILKGAQKADGGSVIQLPETTPSSTDSWGLILTKLPRWENRQLVFRDFKGEMFMRDGIDGADDATLTAFKFIRSAPFCWMFIDLSRDYHAQSTDEFTPDALLTLYRDQVVKNSRQKSHTIVVILTKADVLAQNTFTHGHQLPAPFYREYIVNDELSIHLSEFRKPELERYHFDDVRAAEYVDRMENVSRTLKSYFEQSNFGRNFVNLAYQAGIDLKFTMNTSALSGLTNETVNGQPVNEVVMGDEFDPLRSRRVLDPLFWALELSHRSSASQSATV